MKLKPSMITKNPEIKANVTEKKDFYDDFSEIVTNTNKSLPMDSNTLDYLIHNINLLEPEDHSRIYSFLRSRGINKSFFSTSKRATHFDINKIPNNLKWLLYQQVKMLTENQHRSQMISDMTKQHHRNIENLNVKLIANRQKTDIRPIGQTEKQRFNNLVEMNK